MGVGARKRKLQSVLFTSGLAFLVLGVWSALKSCVTLFLDYKTELEEWIQEMAAAGRQLTEEELKAVNTEFFWVILLLVVIAAALVFVFHVLIGQAAMKEAKGKKKGKAYLVLSIVYIVITVGAYIYNFMDATGIVLYDISELLFDVTSIFAVIMIIKSASELRKLEKEEAGSLAA